MDIFSLSSTSVPVGVVLPFAGSSAPSGWLLCYGQAISRTTYSNLFSVIGTAYGSGDGSTTFNVPDMRGRVPAGKDDMGGSAANRLTGTSGGVNGNALGNSGGNQQHTLSVGEIPSHTHSVRTGASSTGPDVLSSSIVLQNTNSLNRDTINSTGGGGAHNNVQPTIITNYIIKV